MHPLDAPVERSFEPQPRQQQEEPGGAASSPSRGTRAGGENAAISCQEGRLRTKACCAHCCSGRAFVCPGHDAKTTTSHVPASQQCSERQQQTLAGSASAAAVDVDVEPIPNKRPRRIAALPSAAGAAPTTTSSVDQPMATTALGLERFAREVSIDAVFRRVRLGEPAEPEVAYYTTVTIAGHVFRGVLYDVGPNDSGSTSTAAASDTDGSGEVESSISTAGGSCLDLTLGL